MDGTKRDKTGRIVLTDDLRFGRFNFHREETIDAVVRTLASHKTSKVIILSGTDGIGRGYVWSAAIHRLRQQGIDWNVVELDLDGFEPDVDSMQKFIAFLLARREGASKACEAARAPTSEAIEAVAQATAKVSGPIGHTAIGVAILLAAGKSLNAVLKHLESKESTGPLPSLPSSAWLARLLQELAEDRPLALYCRKPAHLTAPIKRILREVGDRNSRLALAIASIPADDSASAWPHALVAPLRVEVSLLTLDEMRSAFTRRFHPHRCPQDVIDALWSASGGKQRDITSRLGELAAKRQLQQDEEGCWYVSGDLRAIAAVAQLDDEFLQPLYVLLEQLNPQTRQDLVRFLAIAALCGDFAPSRSIGRFLDLPPERAEELIDLVDTTLVCPPNRRSSSFAELSDEVWVPYFDDLEYRHAGFPNQSVYHFRSPLIRQAILGQASFCDWPSTATEFLAALRETLPATTRAAAEVHLSVATVLGDTERRRCELLLLSWWVGEQESEALEEILVESLRKRTLHPESLWLVMLRFNRSLLWPPHRCLAVVNAYARQEGGPPLAHLPDVHLSRSILFSEMGRFEAALEDARLAVALLEADDIHGHGDHEILGRSLYQVGDCLSGLRQFAEARPWFERAIAAAEQGNVHGRIDHTALGSSLHQVGHCLSSLEQFAEARPWFERAVAAKMQGNVHGHVDHAALGTSLHQVGYCLSRLGHFTEAHPWFECAVVAKARGDIHGRIHHASLGASFHQVGYCLGSLGRVAEARTWFERAVVAAEQGDVYGRVNHATLASSLAEVGNCLSIMGQHAEARDWFERAVTAQQQGDVHGRVDHTSLDQRIQQLNEHF